MLDILKAALFGIVEGITEWLPVSSTGHMILLDEFVRLDVSPEFWKMFLVVIQLGAIAAVAVCARAEAETRSRAAVGKNPACLRARRRGRPVAG